MGGKGSQKRNGEQVRTGASQAVKSGGCAMSREGLLANLPTLVKCTLFRILPALDRCSCNPQGKEVALKVPINY